MINLVTVEIRYITNINEYIVKILRRFLLACNLTFKSKSTLKRIYVDDFTGFSFLLHLSDCFFD